MALQKLTRGQVDCGMPLPWDVYDEVGKLLLPRGHVVRDADQLQMIMRRGMYQDFPEPSKTGTAAVALDKNYDPFQLWNEIVEKLDQLLHHYEQSAAVQGQFAEIAKSVQVLSEHSKDAALAAMILLTQQNRYSLEHCLHAALLADMVAQRLEWPQERRKSLVCAALSMNISTVDTQQQLTEQAGPLTPEQREAIKNHPKSSVDILSRVGVNDSIWLQSVQDHHETPLGNGYPFGIKEVGEEATLLRTTDVFSAKVSPRLNRKQMNGAQAARVLFTDPGMTTANPFIAVLIKEVGIYPPGSFVKLANGELAVVYKRSSSAHTPVVLSLTNSKGTPEMKPMRRDTAREEYNIKTVVPRDQVNLRINPVALWGNA
ncbi:MAG: HD domain-containing phosphohydrolase [Sterolibacterium sp.]